MEEKCYLSLNPFASSSPSERWEMWPGEAAREVFFGLSYGTEWWKVNLSRWIRGRKWRLTLMARLWSDIARRLFVFAFYGITLTSYDLIMTIQRPSATSSISEMKRITFREQIACRFPSFQVFFSLNALNFRLLTPNPLTTQVSSNARYDGLVGKLSSTSTLSCLRNLTSSFINRLFLFSGGN